MKPWHPGCHHPENAPDNDQFCIFCLRKRGDDAVARVAELENILSALRGSEESWREVARILAGRLRTADERVAKLETALSNIRAAEESLGEHGHVYSLFVVDDAIGERSTPSIGKEPTT